MKRLVVVLAVPTLLLAGCGSSGGTAAPAPSATATTSTAEPDSPSPSATEATATATSPPTKTTKPTGKPATSRCRSADLSIKTGAGGAAAGSRSVNLVFGNTSDRTCALFGYPGVSWVAGDKGSQVNDPFSREAGESGKKTVTLKPGAVAYALVIWPVSLNFDQAQCKPVAVRGYRIYPPDETAAVFVSSPQTVCSAKGVGTGRVHPVSTRAG